MVGLYVNNRSSEHFATLIAQRLKTIETRTLMAARSFAKTGIRVGDRFAIVADGRIVCYAVFGGFKYYADETEFNADYCRHLVGKKSRFAFNPNRGKVGILLSDVVAENRTIGVKRTHGYTWTTC